MKTKNNTPTKSSSLTKTKKQIKAIERDISIIETKLKEERANLDTIFTNIKENNKEEHIPNLKKELRESQHSVKETQAILALNYDKLAQLKRLEASSYEYYAQDLKIQCPLAI